MAPRKVENGTGDHASRRAGRPSTPVLNRGMISDAALAIVTDEGQSSLTMKHLAGRLGVSVSALYNHIANKAELMLLVQDAVMSRVNVSALEQLVGSSDTNAEVLRSALGEWARSYRDVFAAYPSLVPLIATMPVSGATATRRMYDVVSAGLVSGGVPEARIIPVIVAFESFLYGSAMDANAPATIFHSEPEESDAPTFQSAVEAFTRSVDAGSGEVAEVNPYADEPFEWGLSTLLDRTLTLV